MSQVVAPGALVTSWSATIGGARQHEKVLTAVGLAVILPAVFFSIGELTSRRLIPAPAWLVTPIDAALPVVPAAVWLYVSWYVAPAVALSLRVDRFRTVCRAELVALAVCSVGYLMLPIGLPRPPIAAVDMSSALLRLVYQLDPPVNVFPSYHAAVAALLACMIVPRPRVLRLAWSMWMLAICVSCVLTKQHLLFDVVAGVGVGVAVGRRLQ